MAQSIRVVYPGVQGRVRRNVSWHPIIKDTAVLVTAAEWIPSGGLQGLTEGRTHLGDADVFVTNIGVHGNEGGGVGGVEFHLHANFGSPLNLIVTITVFEPVDKTII